jgi:hypothetical protein
MLWIKQSKRLTKMVVLSLAINGGPILAQTISFFRHFTTPGMIQATAVASDASGIYVFGVGPGPGDSASSGVRKYDSAGNELWTRDFTGPAEQFFRAAADASGVYVWTVYQVTVALR